MGVEKICRSESMSVIPACMPVLFDAIHLMNALLINLRTYHTYLPKPNLYHVAMLIMNRDSMTNSHITYPVLPNMFRQTTASAIDVTMLTADLPPAPLTTIFGVLRKTFTRGTMAPQGAPPGTNAPKTNNLACGTDFYLTETRTEHIIAIKPRRGIGTLRPCPNALPPDSSKLSIEPCTHSPITYTIGGCESAPGAYTCVEAS